MSPQAPAHTVTAEYDRVADALYIRLRAGDVARTVEVDDVRVLDLDAEGRPLGVEILYPAENLAITTIAREYGFDDLLEEIDDAVQRELGPVTHPLRTTPVGISVSLAGYGYLTGTSPVFVSVPSSGTATVSTIPATLELDASA